MNLRTAIAATAAATFAAITLGTGAAAALPLPGHPVPPPVIVDPPQPGGPLHIDTSKIGAILQSGDTIQPIPPTSDPNPPKPQPPVINIDLGAILGGTHNAGQPAPAPQANVVPSQPQTVFIASGGAELASQAPAVQPAAQAPVVQPAVQTPTFRPVVTNTANKQSLFAPGSILFNAILGAVIGGSVAGGMYFFRNRKKD